MGGIFAQTRAEIGKFQRGQFGGRIYRCAGFGHHDPGQLEFRMAAHQVGGQLVGFAAGGAVADADQAGAMLLRQVSQRGERAFPIATGFVRVEGGGIHHLAGDVDHRHLDPGANAGIEPDHRVLAGRRGQQQVVQVARENADGFVFGALAQLVHQFGFEVQREFHQPGPACGFQQPLVRRAALVAD